MKLNKQINFTICKRKTEKYKKNKLYYRQKGNKLNTLSKEELNKILYGR